MRRFLTLVCLLCVAIPAGISISGCTRNPAGNYCNGLGYGLKDTDVASIFEAPQTTGMSIAFGQTTQMASPLATTCKGTPASVTSWTYGTTNNQLVDVSPSGNLCAGTWNRNSGGGIPNYTICNYPNPAPSTGGLPYATAYVTVSADSITSNPVEVYVHPQVTSVTLVTEPVSGSAQQCFSQGTLANLDAQACAVGSSNNQYLLCAPASVTSANSSCKLPNITPDIIASGSFTSAAGNTGILLGTAYVSGGSIAGTAGQTCFLNTFNNGSTGATATVTLTGANTIAEGTAAVITAGGTGATSSPTSATLASGTATCSGTVTVNSALGPISGVAGQTCILSNFNNGSVGAKASVTLTTANSVSSGTPLIIAAGGLNATAPPTTATLSSGTATCSGTATVASTMTPVPDCTAALGTLQYSVGTSAIASINGETDQITAEQPGTTVITASIAQGASSAGYFTTCPPKSISVTLANGGTSGTITQGVQQNLTTTVIDSQGNPITGLTLDYQSTDPMDVAVGQGGAVTTNYPGVGSVNAICQPPVCNPSPINVTGLNGGGLSISSNPVKITVPGTASDYVWFGSPGLSQYFVPVELLSGTVGANVRLPYVPNSMVMDRTGNNIYFGSSHELMYYSTFSNTLAKQDPSVPGVVLAVSPSNAQVLINDQVRQVFYLYSVSSSSSTTFGGMGTAAQWTPDSRTLYITDSASAGPGHTDTLYVYSQNTGWTTYPLAASGGANPGAQNVAITIPGVGAYLSGNPTVARTWCPAGTVGNAASTLFYPQGDSVDALTNVLAATTDGQHILGAAVSGGAVTVSDIGITVPSATSASEILTPLACPESANGVMSPLVIQHTLAQVPVSGVNATAVDQVVASPASNLAFITYNGSTTGAALPYYIPGTGGAAGTVGYVPLSGSSAITAPLTGAFSPDDSYFFVATAGDNLVHYITIPANVSTTRPPTDSLQVAPNLPACVPVAAGGNDLGCAYTGTGTVVPVTVITVKPRSTT